MDELQRKYRAEVEELVEASRRLGELGYVTSHGGNLSYKVAGDLILITPTKIVKRETSFDDIVFVGCDGSIVYASPGRRPTGETPMHTRLFKLRPDINGLVHAHPPALTGFAMSNSDALSKPLLPEPVIEIGPIIPVDYAEPISDALAAKFDAAAALSNAWLMKSHGVTICSTEGIMRAVDQLQMAESMAMSAATALSCGGLSEISKEEVQNLENTIRARNMTRPGDPRVIHSLTQMYFGD